MKIGSAIKSIRKKQNISQCELANKVGVSPTSITLFEQDKRYPHPNTLEKICKALNTPELVIYLEAARLKNYIHSFSIIVSWNKNQENEEVSYFPFPSKKQEKKNNSMKILNEAHTIKVPLVFEDLFKTTIGDE